MSSSYGNNIKITIFGQSHSGAIGVCMEGFPAGIELNFDAMRAFLERRAPGRNAYSTARREPDMPEFVSGLVGGVTCGAPITAIIRNTDTRSADYNGLFDVPRPGHADFTAQMKYGGAQDVRGGGHFSGRLTAPLCIAGAICMQFLRFHGVEIAAHISSIGDVEDKMFDKTNISPKALSALTKKAFPVLDDEQSEEMRALIESARDGGDSVGGTIECAAAGLPAGLGSPIFDGMEGRIAQIIFGIPAVKGIEFGSGFGGSAMKGSENNDAFFIDGGGIKTKTNNHGGILGGITSGMPLVFRAAFKPTPSIAIEQDSVSFSKMENVKLRIVGRHDPCIVPRAVPCVEAALAVALCDAFLEGGV